MAKQAWNSRLGCPKISLDCKNRHVETDQGRRILNERVTAAPQEARVGCQKSLGMSGTRKKRHQVLQKQFIDE